MTAKVLVVVVVRCWWVARSWLDPVLGRSALGRHCCHVNVAWICRRRLPPAPSPPAHRLPHPERGPERQRVNVMQTSTTTIRISPTPPTQYLPAIGHDLTATPLTQLRCRTPLACLGQSQGRLPRQRHRPGPRRPIQPRHPNNFAAQRLMVVYPNSCFPEGRVATRLLLRRL